VGVALTNDCGCLRTDNKRGHKVRWAIWIRLPQVSSNTAVVTGPVSRQRPRRKAPSSIESTPSSRATSVNSSPNRRGSTRTRGRARDDASAEPADQSCPHLKEGRRSCRSSTQQVRQADASLCRHPDGRRSAGRQRVL